MLKTHKNRWFTLSNAITASRLVCAPIIAFYIMKGVFWPAFMIFAFAALTDSIDGYLARIFNTETLIGRLLDPVADKVLMTMTFGALAIAHTGVSSWFVIFLICRETLLILGAIFLLCTGRATTIRPSLWGKITTFLQIACIGWFFISILFRFESIKITTIFLIFIIFFSLIAFVDYTAQGLKE